MKTNNDTFKCGFHLTIKVCTTERLLLNVFFLLIIKMHTTFNISIQNRDDSCDIYKFITRGRKRREKIEVNIHISMSG